MTSLGGNMQKFVPTRGLQVQYAMATINTGSPNTSDVRDFGIYGLYGNGGTFNYAGFYRDSTTKRWTAFTSTAAPDFVTGAATSSLAGYTKANLDCGTLFSSAITNSGAVSVGAGLTVVGQIGASDGTVSAPGISFSNELGTGLYRVTTGRLALAAGGSSLLDANTTRILLPTCGIYAPNTGTVSITSPSYSFSSSNTTGHRYSGASMTFSVNGTDVMDLATGAVTNLQRTYVTANGSASSPDITFNDGSGASGIYITGSALTLNINFSIASSRIAYIAPAGFFANQVSTPILTNSGSISVTAAMNLNANNLTTTGSISTAVLTASGTLSVTAPINMNSSNITSVNSLSLSTLTGPATIAVSQNMDMGSNTLIASNIQGASSTVTFNSGSGRLVAGNARFATSVKTANYSVVSTDYMLEFTVSTSVTCTLPLAANVIGQRFVILLNGTGSVVVACSGSDTFQNNATSITIVRNRSAIHLLPSAGGTFWITL